MNGAGKRDTIGVSKAQAKGTDWKPNLNEAEPVLCEKCKGRGFLRASKFFLLPSVAPSNPTGQSLVVEKPGFQCLNCRKWYDSAPGSEGLRPGKGG